MVSRMRLNIIRTVPACIWLMLFVLGFGGLVVSMLASGSQDRGFEPGRSRRIFSGEKIHSMLSFGGEVKPSVQCRSFAAC
jgi:hypothetical protein